jgi:hypothetical protein
VVTVRLVLKLKAGGQEHEQKMEVPGVVIDPVGADGRERVEHRPVGGRFEGWWMHSGSG